MNVEVIVKFFETGQTEELGEQYPTGGVDRLLLDFYLSGDVPELKDRLKEDFLFAARFHASNKPISQVSLVEYERRARFGFFPDHLPEVQEDPDFVPFFSVKKSNRDLPYGWSWIKDKRTFKILFGELEWVPVLGEKSVEGRNANYINGCRAATYLEILVKLIKYKLIKIPEEKKRIVMLSYLGLVNKAYRGGDDNTHLQAWEMLNVLGLGRWKNMSDGGFLYTDESYKQDLTRLWPQADKLTIADKPE